MTEIINESWTGRLLTALVTAVAIIAAGGLVGGGIRGFRAADRFVTVKGVAEKPVRADLAIWPLRIVVADASLPSAQYRMNEGTVIARRFLIANGIDSTQISLQGLRVQDTAANPYQGERAGPRFIIEQTVLVRSNDVDLVQQTSSRVGALVNQGVVFSSGQEYGPGGPTYLFTKLNELKPTMIAEATAEARKAAEQFARDSKSRLGGIRSANQGVFVILPRDEIPGFDEKNQPDKIVRVVSTIEYRLAD
jgi:hypothetical protein